MNAQTAIRFECVPSRPMTWHDRLDSYVRETGFPRCMGVDEAGRVYGVWVLGNDYRVASGYYGGYPATYLRRVKALFPDKHRPLHLFSGRVDTAAFPGDTVDISPVLEPTYVDDAQTLENVPLGDYDLILADPPYSGEDAERYGTTMVKRNRVMRALERVHPGTHVAWLDMVLPIYKKAAWRSEADIGIRRSTNHRFRGLTIFCRKDPE